MRNKIVILVALLVMMVVMTGVAAALTVTINQDSSQADPTSNLPIIFEVVFSENVNDFETGDVNLSGTAGATTAIVTGHNKKYHVEVNGITHDGTVIANINAGVAHSNGNNPNMASSSIDNIVTYDAPTPEATGKQNWTGQGIDQNYLLDDVECDSSNTPYLLWIFTTGGGNPTGDEILTINNVPQAKGVVYGGNVHFETQFFNLNTLTAYVTYNKNILGNGHPNLVISHGCTGEPSIPEFPLLALPIAAVIGLVFFFQHKKKKEE